MRQPTRRKNIRKTINALRAGQPQDAPLVSAKWPAWVAGNRKRAKSPVKSPQDLVRRGTPVAKMPRDRMCRVPKLPAPPPLPARTAKRPSGKAERRERIRDKRARAQNPSLANRLFDFGPAELLAATGPGSIRSVAK